jgi:hypothetical protein
MRVNPENRDAALSYIDKVYSSMTRAWDLEKRVFDLQVILSVVLIFLSAGLVSVAEDFDFGGGKFKIAPWFLLTLGGILLSYLLTAYFSVADQLVAYRREVKRLYGALGYRDDAIDNPITSPFENPAILHSLGYASMSLRKKSQRSFARKYEVARALGAIVSFWVLLPLGAQVAASWRLAHTFGAWVWIPALALIGLTWIGFSVRFKTYMDGDDTASDHARPADG